MSTPLDKYIFIAYASPMNPQQVVSHYGGVAKTAEALGLTRQAVYLWLGAGEVPIGWQAWLERETGGKLRATLRRPNAKVTP